MSYRYKYVWLILGICVLLNSCARAPVKAPRYPPTEVYPGESPGVRKDVYHVVGPGETIWRISKMYNVPMAMIVSSNKLGGPENIKMGQKLLIPDAQEIRPVVSLYPSSQWKYIVVHHSASESGNALSIFNAHTQRGFDGAGYHFIIDNGSAGKKDGHIEATPRWIKQKDGAHCKAADMNHLGIGICLVGNFSKERVSRRQMDSLVYLVNKLRKYYKISQSHVLGHRQVPGAKTECPGKYFPFDELNAGLSKEN